MVPGTRHPQLDTSYPVKCTQSPIPRQETSVPRLSWKERGAASVVRTGAVFWPICLFRSRRRLLLVALQEQLQGRGESLCVVAVAKGGEFMRTEGERLCVEIPGFPQVEITVRAVFGYD